MADEETGSASAATGKSTENDGKEGIHNEKAVLQRPPSGRLKGTAKHINNTNKTTTLKTTQLMFEPTPPPAQPTRSYLKSRNSQYRRTLSAHGRIGTPTQPENSKTLNDVSKQRTVLNKSRPRSAIEPGQQKKDHISISNLEATTATAVTPVPNQVLTLNVTETDCAETTSRTSGGESTKQNGLQQSPRRQAAAKGRSIPKGIIQLAPWLTEDVPIELCGVEPQTCLMFLPCVADMEELPPELPPVQHYDECVIPYTVIPKAPKPFDPKKLFHYDVERHIREAEALYDRRNIYSVDGRLIHNGKRYGQQRSADIIKQEIDDLEGLLAGIGRSDGNSIVVQYQEEINKLQRDVRQTLAQCPKYEEKLEEEPPDLMGLRAFIKEREEVIGKIKCRREACMAELDSLAIEADVGMTMQKEVLDAIKNM